MKIRSNYKHRPHAIAEYNSGEVLLDPTNFIPLNDVIKRSLRGEQLPIYHRGFNGVSQVEDISRDITDVTEAPWARRNAVKKEHSVPMDNRVIPAQSETQVKVEPANNNTALV